MSRIGLLTRREAAHIAGVSVRALDKAVEEQIVRPSRRAGQALLPVEDVAVVALLREIPVSLPVATKQRIRSWLRALDPAMVGSEFELSAALRVSYTQSVADVVDRLNEYVRLREAYIARDPGVMGGEPVIRGSRVPVRSLARQIELGEDPDVLREDYPHIPAEAFEAAALWAAANPRRGRPVGRRSGSRTRIGRGEAHVA
jgi:uncharacterized protein (DUF433 family)